jgi:hypothetical protein
VCVRFDKLEDLVTVISNVDQFAIKDWDMRRVSDRWHQVERVENGEREHTYSKAVANEHERRARQPQSTVNDSVPVRAAPGRPSRAIRPIWSSNTASAKSSH